MQARIYKSTGSWYVAKTNAGELFNARMKGIFKIDGITSTNPVAVGDIVNLEIEDTAESSAIITEITERNNYIARISPRNKNQHHIIASNIDQCLLIATLKEPKTSQGFIDRCLVSAEAFHIPSIIVFNKTDVYKQKEWNVFENLKTIYESIGYPVYKLSVKHNEGIDDIKQILTNKMTLFFGHSGVGKSTLINLLIPQLELQTQEVSNWSGKGMHTTTFAEMFDLPFNGKIIDTPGLREFAITGIERPELSHYFIEMKNFLQQCRFNNCLHLEEPGCAVKKAVEEKKISLERYISYCNILASMPEDDY
jgi:ribosome biogenesis GTPase / thiamine phosphate phosphatase